MVRRLRLVGIVAVIALLALFTLVPLAGAAPRAAETKTVSIKDFAFDPKTISVNVGDTITWTNEGPSPHTVSADDGSFDAGNLDKGATFSHTFDKAGTFAYYCKYHGAKGGVSMAASIAVAAPAVAAPAMAEPSGTVDAADQAIVNGGITVANVTAGQDGWIVAHLDEGGKPGKVLGNTAVKTGENKNVVIKLSEDVPVGGKLWPMLHIDAGVVGTYEFPGADAPVIVGGNIVMKQIAVTAAAAAPAQAEKDAVDADDQPISNGSITVAEIYASQDGWIVAHLDEGGKPGKVLGNTAVKKGESNNVVIKLSEDVPVGGKLWPMLHIDAGVIGTYEFPGADAPVIVDGNIIMKQIAVTAAAAAPAAATKDAVDADDQPIKNGSITVAEIYASQDGWIVAHLDEGGKPGKVIGNTAVKKGESNNVVIKLSEDVPVGGKLWPMLHIDAGVIGTYEFPGADAPVIVDGNIIMKQITVTAAGAAAPAKLPTTGGEDAPVGLLLAAFGLLLAGALLTLRPRRRA
jgi:LPXTG-motif cell wall-anchored protein